VLIVTVTAQRACYIVGKITHMRSNQGPRAVSDLLELAELLDSGAARRLRVAAGIPLRAVAADCGADAVSVLRWERGERRPRGDRAKAYLRSLREMARALDGSK
jgi:DNA-binding transcriptional regulator YiaG